MFLLATASTFSGLVLTACAGKAQEMDISDVPVGSAIIRDGIILAQPEPGVYKAYSADCPHQHSQITEVDGDLVRCPTHHSEFSIVDGAVLTGPARDPLKDFEISTVGTTATISG
ncbi:MULTISPECIES: Rieske (2Fe-2S) protein [unclassified Corynebacterium]|uniref:Rieske (2Fe-2S) protein n=1 Tax=unclassified Corynebacterium TaxID=2624378 RepID=UPI0037C0ECD7